MAQKVFNKINGKLEVLYSLAKRLKKASDYLK